MLRVRLSRKETVKSTGAMPHLETASSKVVADLYTLEQLNEFGGLEEREHPLSVTSRGQI